MLFIACSFGDIGGREVVDLGCGGGILSVGASLLGASKVTGIDVDAGAVADARRNIAEAGVDVDVLPLDGREGCRS